MHVKQHRHTSVYTERSVYARMPSLFAVQQYGCEHLPLNGSNNNPYVWTNERTYDVEMQSDSTKQVQKRNSKNMVSCT